MIVRAVIFGVLVLAGCSNAPTSPAHDLSADFAAGACVHNSDCPNGELCLPPCNCAVDDAGRRCDIFVASCVPSIQGLPCRVQGDSVVCCQ